MRRKLQNKKMIFKAMVFSFVIAMLPLTGEASAAPKRGIVLSGRKKVITAKEGLKIYFGDKTLDLDLLVDGKPVKEGVRWWTKNTKTIKIDKDGKLFPLKNGKAVLAARYKGIDFKLPVVVGTKAVGIYLTEEEEEEEIKEISLEEGEKKRFKIHYLISEEAKKAGGKVTTFSAKVYEEKTKHLKISGVKSSRTLIEVEGLTYGKSTLRCIAGEDVNKLKKKGTINASVKVEVMDSLAAVYEEDGSIRLTGKNLTGTKEDYVLKKDEKDYRISELTLTEDGKNVLLKVDEVLEAGSYTLMMGKRKTVFEVIAPEDKLIDENDPNEVEEIE